MENTLAAMREKGVGVIRRMSLIANTTADRLLGPLSDSGDYLLAKLRVPTAHAACLGIYCYAWQCPGVNCPNPTTEKMWKCHNRCLGTDTFYCGYGACHGF